MSGGREGKEELNIPSGIKRREGGGDVKVDFLFSVIRTGKICWLRQRLLCEEREISVTSMVEMFYLIFLHFFILFRTFSDFFYLKYGSSAAD